MGLGSSPDGDPLIPLPLDPISKAWDSLPASDLPSKIHIPQIFPHVLSLDDFSLPGSRNVTIFDKESPYLVPSHCEFTTRRPHIQSEPMGAGTPRHHEDRGVSSSLPCCTPEPHQSSAWSTPGFSECGSGQKGSATLPVPLPPCSYQWFQIPCNQQCHREVRGQGLLGSPTSRAQRSELRASSTQSSHMWGSFLDPPLCHTFLGLQTHLVAHANLSTGSCH